MNKRFNLHLLTNNLPKAKKYRVLSKEKITEYLKQRSFIKYVHEDSNYRFNKDVIAVYNFEDQLLNGKYASFIIDAKKGFILSKKTPKRMLHHMFNHQLLANVSLQKMINQILNIKFHHGVSLWQYAFASINGYCDKSSDWVGLHQMVDYKCKARAVVLTSKKIHGVQYQFVFEHGQKHFAKRLNEAITHNWVMSKLIENTIAQHGWHIHECGKISQEKTLLTNEDYLIKKDIVKDDEHLLKELVDQMRHACYENFGKAMFSDLGMEFNMDDFNHIKRKAERKLSIM